MWLHNRKHTKPKFKIVKCKDGTIKIKKINE